MDSSGKINTLGKQYIGAEGPQIESSEIANAITPSTWVTVFFALSASVEVFALFYTRDASLRFGSQRVGFGLKWN